MEECLRNGIIRAALLVVGLIALGDAADAQAPTITSQPASQTVDIGTTAMLSVIASNATGYQWYQGTTPVANGGDFSGSLTATLTITKAQAADSGSFVVVVSNASGYVTSATATFTAAVLHAPTITSPLTLNVIPQVPFTYTITGTDLPSSFGAMVPSGVTFDATTGTLSGVLAAAGTVTVPISAGNSLGTTDASLVITAAPPATQYAYQQVTGGSIPTGLTMSSTLGLCSSLTSLSTITTQGQPGTLGASGEVGNSDGPPASARFFHPTGLAADAGGNLYLADTGNDTIRVYSGGSVATLAGSPQVSGSLDATGTAARFNAPTALAVGSDGTVYIADTGNNTIRKITSGGVVTTLAGTAGQTGSTDGTGGAARFNAPAGIAVDGSGNVYVGDTGNGAVRKVTPAGVVTTVASVAPLGCLAIDTSGNLYAGSSAVVEISPTGTVTPLGPLVPAIRVVSSGSAYYAQSGMPQSIAEAPQSGLAVDGQGNVYFVNAPSGGPNYSGIMKLEPFVPLSVVSNPVGQQVFVDDTATLTFTVAGSNPQYVWFATGFPISGGSPENGVEEATTSTFNPPTSVDGSIVPNETGDSGSYSVIAYNAGSYVTSEASVNLLETPIVVLSGTVAVGQSAILTCYVNVGLLSGPVAGDLAYQWTKNGTPIPGATGSTLSLAPLALSDAGQYQVLVTASGGDARSSIIGALINFSGNNPVVTTTPASQTVYTGSAATFTVVASGTNLAYQWLLDGVAIPGATNATYTIPSVAVANAGSYSVSVSGVGGLTTTSPVTLDVNTTRLVNLSVRGTAGSGANALIVGFVTAGSDPMQLLLRGIGPGLVPFGVADVLAEPQLNLYSSTGTLLATNAGWGGDAELAAAFSAVGAFQLSASSADSALLLPEEGGAYTAQLTGLNGGQGNALAEIYDTDTGSPAQHLINLSARGVVGTGAAIIIGGFVVAGNASETVLVRGIGPGLGAFGLSGLLANPVLTVLDSNGNTVATNTVWGGTAALSTVFSKVGAFALAANSLDSALLVTLPPGAYTAQLSGANATTGLGLLEIYEVR